MRTLCACSLVVFVILPCLIGSISPAGADEPLKIGVYLPMTGSVAAYGDMEWAGIQIARSMEPEALGKKVELLLVDTKSDKIEAANAVTMLVERDKVVGILGEAISGNTMAGNHISELARVPSVSPSATSPLVNQGKKFAFRACFIDPFQGEVAARFARSHLKADTAALIIDNSQDYSVGLGSFFAKQFTKDGGKVVSTAYIQTGDQDFSAQLSAVQTANPEILYAPNYYTETALLAKQARDLGIRVPILTGDGAHSDTLIHIGGRAVEGMFLTGHFHRDAAASPRAKEFIVRFTERYKKDPDAFAALGGDAYFLLIDAIRRAGSTDGTKIRDALASTRGLDVVSGSVSMGEGGTPIKGVVINQVEKGRFVYVTTIEP
ncbi:MAG: ABC transporter substrate-binding protein [Syntrophobacteraceae bacterium]|nr:ABC transporter substrate-binding protein [Syntrophobacteraceae bacterium]